MYTVEVWVKRVGEENEPTQGRIPVVGRRPLRIVGIPAWSGSGPHCGEELC
jgi:hypothetical protein